MIGGGGGGAVATGHAHLNAGMGGAPLPPQHVNPQHIGIDPVNSAVTRDVLMLSLQVYFSHELSLDFD